MLLIYSLGWIMNYTFFDIECCDGVHICSIGYIQTSFNFRVLSKCDILINPEMRFRLGPRNNTALSLSYPNMTFFKQQPFPHFYDRIKKLLLNKNTFLIGFSINNDFNFINLACERYGLKQLNMRGFDVQKLQMIISKDTQVRSLDKVAEMHNIFTNKLKLHKSCDDAELTMLILRKICKEQNKTINDIINAYPSCLVQSKLYVRKVKPKRNTAKTHSILLNSSLPKIDYKKNKY